MRAVILIMAICCGVASYSGEEPHNDDSWATMATSSIASKSELEPQWLLSSRLLDEERVLFHNWADNRQIRVYELYDSGDRGWKDGKRVFVIDPSLSWKVFVDTTNSKCLEWPVLKTEAQQAFLQNWYSNIANKKLSEYPFKWIDLIAFFEAAQVLADYPCALEQYIHTLNHDAPPSTIRKQQLLRRWEKEHKRLLERTLRPPEVRGTLEDGVVVSGFIGRYATIWQVTLTVDQRGAVTFRKKVVDSWLPPREVGN